MIKKLLILFLVLASFAPAMSQTRINTKAGNLPYFERSKFHFGFTLGGNNSSFRIKYDLTTIDSLISLNVGSEGGFNIGFLGSMRFNDYFTLRFLPSLAFAQRNFDYVFEGNEKNISVTRIVESTYVMFPLLLKYRSARYNNFAAYVVAGPSLAYDLSSQFDVNNEVIAAEQVLKVKRQNWFAELGFGTDFFLEYFKFSVELKYSRGLNDVFVDDNSFWAKPIQEIKPGMFTVSLHFEG
jgi:hypothetical protein